MFYLDRLGDAFTIGSNLHVHLFYVPYFKQPNNKRGGEKIMKTISSISQIFTLTSCRQFPFLSYA